ncbi:glycosyltransferase [Stomatobaculum longum]|nr:glycosyltransferase [Stomatobaculum longum]
MRGKRVVFFSTPAYGHLQAVYPVLARLVRAGVRVDWYCTETYRELVTATGAHFHPYCVDFSRYPLDRLTADFFSLYRGLLALNRRCYLRYRREIRENPPDLLLYDSMCSFGKNLAKQFRVPSVCLCTTLAYNLPVLLGTNLLLPSLKLIGRHLPQFLELYRRERHFRRREGLPRCHLLDLFVNAGDKTLVFTPPEFQPFVRSFPRSFVFVGTTIRDRLKPDIRYEDCDIYLSFGSIFAARAGKLETLLQSPLFRGKRVIVSAGGAAADLQKRLGSERLSFVRRTEQLSLLKKTRLFVNHGGLNSVYESLYFGIFQLCRPQQEEQKLTALVAERKKFGLYVRNLGDLTAEEIEKRRRAWWPQIQKYRRILRAADGTTQACREISKLLFSTGYPDRKAVYL